MRMNGIFAIDKPSGISSATFLGKVQAIFTKSAVFKDDLDEMRANKRNSYRTKSGMKSSRKFDNVKVKMGHGGTLDPLASGVLIIGVGKGTKQLPNYLKGCVKTYETEALLGISTTTGDSEGEILGRTSVQHVTKEAVLATREKFIGDLKQTPPIFAALKMNGKPLYEYAREGLPLPKPIEPRQVKVENLTIIEEDLLTTEHNYEALKSQLDEDGNPLELKFKNNPTINDDILYFSEQYYTKAEAEGLPKTVEPPFSLAEGESLPEKLPLLHFVTSVSSGTYIRSIISDFGKALSSSAYMVKLIRVQQAQWELGKNVFTLSDFESRSEEAWCEALSKVIQTNGDLDLAEILEEASSKHPLPTKEEDEIKEEIETPQETTEGDK